MAWNSEQTKLYKKGDVILDTYLVEDVRSGGMGNVYIAEHTKWKLKLAIKAPNEKMLSDKGLFSRVLKEADAWIDLGLHPNIAYCYYVRNLEAVPHIFVEYVNGGNLRDWIETGKCYDLGIGLDLAIQFCHGMEHAHSRGMIHRDIKPANILMTKEGTLKVTDFGLVKTSGLDRQPAGAQRELRGVTQFGQVMGTLAYMSPEQYETPIDVDLRTDVYSFGVCMYEMLCGKPPYDQTSASIPAAYIAKLAGKAHREPSLLRRDIPPDIGQILKKCVSLEREKRYSSIEEIRDDLTLAYRRLFNADPPHAKSETLNLKADGLNNRGVSYVDLGREEEALMCWEEALRINPVHFESAYNHGYLKWNRIEMTQAAVLGSLEGCMGSAGTKADHWTALSWLYLEMGHLDRIEKIQQSSSWQPEDLFLYAWKNEISRLIRTFIGHSDEVNTIAITPDGSLVLSGSRDKTLKLWEISTGKEIRTFTGHSDEVTAIAITPDGKFAISGSWDNTLKLWEIATGKEIRTFFGHTEKVSSVLFTPDGRYFLSVSYHAIKLWEITNEKEIRTFTLSTERVNYAAITHDGRFVVSSIHDNSGKSILKLWEIATGKEILAAAWEEYSLNLLAITPDDRYILVDHHNSMILYEIVNGKKIMVFNGHNGFVSSVAITPDGQLALSGSFDTTLKLWEISTGKEIKTFTGHTDALCSVKFTPNRRFALSGSADHTIKLWDVFKQPTNNEIFPMLSKISELSDMSVQDKRATKLIESAETCIKLGRYSEAVKQVRKAQLIPGFECESNILDMCCLPH